MHRIFRSARKLVIFLQWSQLTRHRTGSGESVRTSSQWGWTWREGGGAAGPCTEHQGPATPEGIFTLESIVVGIRIGSTADTELDLVPDPDLWYWWWPSKENIQYRYFKTRFLHFLNFCWLFFTLLHAELDLANTINANLCWYGS